MTIDITGSLSGSADRHTPESLHDAVSRGWTVLPGGSEEAPAYEGTLADLDPVLASAAADAPVFLFAHGSSGIGTPVKALGRFVASLGWVFFAPDSFVLPDRLTYTSPVAQADYERIHGLRSEELLHAFAERVRIPGQLRRFVIAGTSEGGVAAARFVKPEGAADSAEVGRLIFSWPCEDNYHVESHRSAVPDTVPVLNIMSTADPYFSKKNPWLDNDEALGHAGRTLAQHPDAAILLIPGAPHTTFALPQVRASVKAFLGRVAHP